MPEPPSLHKKSIQRTRGSVKWNKNIWFRHTRTHTPKHSMTNVIKLTSPKLKSCLLQSIKSGAPSWFSIATLFMAVRTSLSVVPRANHSIHKVFLKLFIKTIHLCIPQLRQPCIGFCLIYIIIWSRALPYQTPTTIPVTQYRDICSTRQNIFIYLLSTRSLVFFFTQMWALPNIFLLCPSW